MTYEQMSKMGSEIPGDDTALVLPKISADSRVILHRKGTAKFIVGVITEWRCYRTGDIGIWQKRIRGIW